MNVSVERYQRRKYVSQENSPMLYYVRQKSGTVRVMDVEKLADAIEANSSLTAGDVKPAIEAFVEQLRLSLTQGDKVKIDGLGTFHITLCSEGTEKEKDCTVRSIRKVNVRFVADKALHLVNASHTSTRSENKMCIRDSSCICLSITFCFNNCLQSQDRTFASLFDVFSYCSESYRKDTFISRFHVSNFRKSH